MDADARELVRRYYDALDDHAYDALTDLLAPGFVQRRPDRRFEDRTAFVRFMREERPATDTSHEIVEVVVDRTTEAPTTGSLVAVRGRLLDGDGALLFEFADHFEIKSGSIVRLETYTR